jgi:hypothetical protein
MLFVSFLLLKTPKVKVKKLKNPIGKKPIVGKTP